MAINWISPMALNYQQPIQADSYTAIDHTARILDGLTDTRPAGEGGG